LLQLKFRNAFAIAFFLGLFSANARAATLTVCATGCGYTSPQTAVDAASPGDTVLLQSGATYGNLVLKPKTNPSNLYVVIMTGVSSTGTVLPSSTFPVADVRTGPSFSAVLAKFVPVGNNNVAIRTVTPGETGGACSVAPCVSSYYELRNIEVGANNYGGNALISLGSNDTAGGLPGANSQDNLFEEPHHFIIDRVYVHGDPVSGQERGIQVSARDIVIKNSYVAVKSMSEKQPIWMENSSGNVTITNCYLEGSGENFMSGGDIPRMNRDTTVTGTPTTTSITLVDAPADFLQVGLGLSVMTGGVLKYTHVTSISGSVIGIEDNGWVADVPGAVNYSVVPHGLTFTKNWLYKPPAWRNPIVSTPQSVTTSTSTTGGTLAAGTYSYRVVARMPVAGAQTTSVNARSTASVEVSQTTTGTTSTVTISWAPVAGNGVYYYIYGRNLGGENIRWSTTGTTFTDTGAAGTTENVPTSSGSVWQVKNLFELKKMYTALVEGNLLEYSWLQAQTGYAVLFTVLNNSTGVNGNDSTVVRDVTFRHNWIRHAAGAIQLSGRAADGDISDRTRDITIYNNIFEDIGTAWGAKADIISMSTGNQSTFVLPYKRTPLNITVNHNTVLSDQGKSFFIMDYYKQSEAQLAENMDVTNNIFRRNDNGLRAYNAGGLMGEGNTAWVAATDSASLWSNNIVVGASCSLYPGAPASTWCPAEATLESAFANFATSDYRVTSVWNTAATDGTAVGADPTLITPLTAVAQSGNNAGSITSVPPTILTTSLPSGTVGATYATSLSAEGGVTPYVWTLVSGSSLPAGLSLSTTGVISGSPSSPGTTTFTVRITGADAGTSTKSFDLTVTDVIADVTTTRPDRVDYVEIGIFRRDTPPDATDEVRVGDLWYDMSTNTLNKATATAPTIVWTPVGGSSTSSARTILFFSDATSNGSWTLSSTAGGSQFTSSVDTFADLTGITECRVFMRTNAISDGNIWVKYTTGVGTPDTDLGASVAQTPGTSLAAGSITQNFALGAWTSIAAGAKTFVRLGLWGFSTSGATDTAVRNAGMVCR
jgi:hypothetical protein